MQAATPTQTGTQQTGTAQTGATQTGTGLNAQLEEVAPDVYSYVQPDGTWFINNTGFVVGGDSVIAIDATSTHRRTQAYLDAIASVTDLPVSVLVNTHHHGDHTHGNYLFKDATIVAHRTCREVMLATGIGDYSAAFPGVDWGELKFRAPDLTFESTLTLHTDRTGHTGKTEHTSKTEHTTKTEHTSQVGPVELIHVGHVAHTEGDVIAWVPERKVLFSGDLIFHGGTPFALFGSIQGTLDALDLLQSFEAEVIVPGHGPAFGKPRQAGASNKSIVEVLDEQRDYLRFVQTAAVEGIAAGRTPLEQSLATDLGAFARLTDSERLAGNMHVAYREAGAAAQNNAGVAAATGAAASDTASDTASAVEAQSFAQNFIVNAIGDMVAYNNGELPRCIA